MKKSVRIMAVIMQLWLLCSAADTAWSEAQGLHADWLHNFMASVDESVRRVPLWHAKRDRIQAYVHDIEYHVEQMVAHATKADRDKAEEEGRHVAALLRRAQGRGYLLPEDVESLIRLINRYLPVAPI